MNRMIKIFCSGKDQKDLSTWHRVVEQYEGFMMSCVVSNLMCGVMCGVKP